MDTIDFTLEKKKFGEHVRRLLERLESTDYAGKSISQHEITYRTTLITKKTFGKNREEKQIQNLKPSLPLPNY